MGARMHSIQNVILASPMTDGRPTVGARVRALRERAGWFSAPPHTQGWAPRPRHRGAHILGPPFPEMANAPPAHTSGASRCRAGEAAGYIESSASTVFGPAMLSATRP
jgi:hypothetical protein